MKVRAVNGYREWVVSYSAYPDHAPGVGTARALIPDDVGGVVVVGESQNSPAGSYDYAVVRYTASGSVEWATRYDGPAGGDDMPTGAGIDQFGNIHVSGRSPGFSAGRNGNDFCTLKISPGGVIGWVARYDSSTGVTDEASALAVDPYGGFTAVGLSANWLGSLLLPPLPRVVHYADTSRTAVTLACSDVVAASGELVTLSACLRRADTAGPLPDRRLWFAVDGVPVGSAFSDALGWARLAYQMGEIAAGATRPVRASFFGDATFAGGSCAGVLTGARTRTALYVPDRSGIIGEWVTLKAYLTRTSDHAPVPDQTVGFKVDATQVGAGATDAAGLASFAYQVALSEGTHSLTATYAGSTTYQESSGAASLTALVSDSSLTVPDRSGVITDTVWLKAYVYSKPGRLALEGKSVGFWIDGVYIASATSNAWGRSMLAWVVPPAGGAGTRALSCAFGGDAGYRPSAATATVTVARAPVYIWPYVRSTYRGSPLRSKAYCKRLWDYARLTGVAIEFALDGTSIGSAVTDADGIASLVTTDTSGYALGAHTVRASFAGDAWVAPGWAETTVNILAP